MELLETRVSSLNAKLKSILGGSATPVSKGAGPGRPRKRSMSPAAKAKLAASARLRWKKAKAAGKNRL